LCLPQFKGINKLDRTAKLAIAAANEAWLQSGLNESEIDPDRISVIAGTSRGPVGKWEETYKRQVSGKVQLPSLAATGTMAALSGSMSQFLGARGTSLTLSSTCSSGASAIGIGAGLIVAGSSDVAIVGGAESVINEAIISVMKSAGLLGNDAIDEKTCKPADFITLIIASLMTDSAPPTIATSELPATIKPAPIPIADAPDEQVDESVNEVPLAPKNCDIEPLNAAIVPVAANDGSCTFPETCLL
jgi:hypothetical protein